MNLRQLELFVSVAREGSFSRGAESSLRTQSTVSQQISALESELGARLFDRTGKGVELTAAGRLLLESAGRVLAEVASLRAGMAAFLGNADQELVIGASNIPAAYLIPGLLPELNRRHPGLSLSVTSADSRAILERLQAAAFELAVVGDAVKSSDCDYQPLALDELQLVVAPAHRWAQKGAISLEELFSEPLLLRESGSGSGGALAAALQAVCVDPHRLKVAARLGSNEAVREAVSAGCGGAFLSWLSVRREVARNELVTIPVHGLEVTRRLWLARRSNRTLSPAAETVAALLLELYPPDARLPDLPILR